MRITRSIRHEEEKQTSKAKEEYNRQGVEKLKKLAKDQFDADIEPVFRCKNCKYYTEHNECTNPAWKGASDDYPVMKETDYCSIGEMK